MQESFLSLTRFIDDFNLRQPDGTVRFNAKIEFNLDGKSEAETLEIHIITSDSLGTIYLLPHEGSADSFPDMFDINHFDFIYNSKCLEIKSGDLNVNIFPL
jgi:hypothetical protein